MCEEFPSWYEWKDKIEKSGIYATTDHVDNEGVLDAGQDLLLVLHVSHLFVPHDVLQHHQLQSDIITTALVFTK